MTEECERYRVGPTDGAEPPLTTEALIAAAHAHPQGVPYETGDQLLNACRSGCAPWPTRCWAAR